MLLFWCRLYSKVAGLRFVSRICVFFISLTTEKILDLAKKDYVDYIHNKGDLRPIAVVC